jgi:hypothetical protein
MAGIPEPCLLETATDADHAAASEPLSLPSTTEIESDREWTKLLFPRRGRGRGRGRGMGGTQSISSGKPSRAQVHMI